MKKIVLSAFVLLFTANAFAERPCRVWRVRHHHRVCVRR